MDLVPGKAEGVVSVEKIFVNVTAEISRVVRIDGHTNAGREKAS